MDTSNVSEFRAYVPILEQKAFALYPVPEGIEASNDRFEYVDDDQTHVRIRSVTSNKEYLLPIALVEFANPGVLRLTRQTKPFNGSFV